MCIIPDKELELLIKTKHSKKYHTFAKDDAFLQKLHYFVNVAEVSNCLLDLSRFKFFNIENFEGNYHQIPIITKHGCYRVLFYVENNMFILDNIYHNGENT